PTLLLRACPVVLVGIAQSQRQVLHAVRVQVLDGVHALRDLLIALTELRSEHAARSLDGVGADVRQAAPRTRREEMQLALALEAAQEKPTRGIRPSRGAEERPQTRPGGGTVLSAAIGDRRLVHARGRSRPGPPPRGPAAGDRHDR